MSKPIVTELEPVFLPTENVWLIASANNPLASYRVSLRAMTCNCPHYTHRLAGTDRCCKHMVTAAEAEQNAMEARKARVARELMLREVFA